MLFEVKIMFLHKNPKRTEIKCNDAYTAMTTALKTLDSTEKDNVSAVMVIDVK